MENLNLYLKTCVFGILHVFRWKPGCVQERSVLVIPGEKEGVSGEPDLAS